MGCWGLTIVEIRDGFQNPAARVQRLWCVDSARGTPAREKDNLGVDKRSRGDALVQGLAERKCGGHLVRDPGDPSPGLIYLSGEHKVTE